MASDSTGLPGCRAYELVTPADAGGEVDYRLSLNEIGDEPSPGLNRGLQTFEDISTEGDLASQLRGPLDVDENGEDVFWDSTATPAGTGAIADGGEFDAFRSARAPTGWSTTDLLPSGLQTPSIGGLPKVVIGASADGSTALVLTPLALQASAFTNPQEAALGSWPGFVIYRVYANGTTPQLVTHGDFLLPESTRLEEVTGFGPFQVLSASPDLSEVAFKSDIPLEGKTRSSERPCEQGTNEFARAPIYLSNASSAGALAHFVFNYRGECAAPNVVGVPAVLPDGHPILRPNPLNTPIPGPLVENNPNANDPSSLTPLAGSSGSGDGTLLSFTPDSRTAYIQSSEALDSFSPYASGSNIYAVSTTLGTTPEAGGATPGVTCISCATDQADVTYVGTSANGAHLLFTTDQGLWEWDTASGAQLLTSATDLGTSTVIVSENGQYVVGLTRQLAHNPNGTADLYEFHTDQATPTLITSGTSADTYALYVSRSPRSRTGEQVASGVSDDGAHVVYEASAPEVNGHQPLQVIDEWNTGDITQLSPVGSLSGYSVQAVTGDQLQNVFFIAQDPLVPWDENDGQADVYDARVEGGFPPCTSGDPDPRAGQASCATPTSTPNPQPPTMSAFTTNLTPASVSVPTLPTDTSHPYVPKKAKAKTCKHGFVRARGKCAKRKAKRPNGKKATRKAKKVGVRG